MKIKQDELNRALIGRLGYGYDDYLHETAKTLQTIILDKYDVNMALSECVEFWAWRSALWDAGFLGVGTTNEVCDFFERYLEELGISYLSDKSNPNTV